MANYGRHADCYPPGHPRGGPCSPHCPYNSPSQHRPTVPAPAPKKDEYIGKHRKPEKS